MKIETSTCMLCAGTLRQSCTAAGRTGYRKRAGLQELQGATSTFFEKEEVKHLTRREGREKKRELSGFLCSRRVGLIRSRVFI
jgi:hypothetical protein